MVQVLLTHLSPKLVALADSVGGIFSVGKKPDIPVLEVFCILSRLSVTDIIGITRTDRGSYRNLPWDVSDLEKTSLLLPVPIIKTDFSCLGRDKNPREQIYMAFKSLETCGSATALRKSPTARRLKNPAVPEKE
ncbi:hypothetical protein AV530_004527 [Patagioenas fasciata monilis]|uniref:Uncharacterized protein n=1 Tax=Patagioenas fasciata monilis TaxID=372326 RepID=A0A1V4J5I3_PATFA|nr:hypothetical protein AV530_004527 [Patagioenas fasciata monilis]